jgi:hypothetical protein
MGTLSKALGVSGGYVCGSRTLIDWLVNRARSFIFSTAPPPAMAAAATAAVEFLASEAGELRRLAVWSRIKTLRSALRGSALNEAEMMRDGSAIHPLIVGDEQAALDLSRALQARGFSCRDSLPDGRERRSAAAHHGDCGARRWANPCVGRGDQTPRPRDGGGGLEAGSGAGAEKRRREQTRIAVRVDRPFRRNVFRTFGWWRRLIDRTRACGVLRQQPGLECRAAIGCSGLGRLAGSEDCQGEGAGCDFDDHFLGSVSLAESVRCQRSL